jgi:ABC-2 type transport system permease protein
VFFDVKHVPSFLRDIAQALPLDHLIMGLSGGLVAHHGGLSSHLTALLVLAIWTVVGATVAVRGFSWDAHRG